MIVLLQVKALVSTVDEILDFQKKFLKELGNIVDSETGFDAFDEVPQFQVFFDISLRIIIILFVCRRFRLKFKLRKLSIP